MLIILAACWLIGFNEFSDILNITKLYTERYFHNLWKYYRQQAEIIVVGLGEKETSLVEIDSWHAKPFRSDQAT